ncbi:MAG: hypothetical protein QOF12_1407 [Solirubrobacteraceae bacterium]|nr:hypothetical protein [Solirubrobacteraceae bacterium]
MGKKSWLAIDASTPLVTRARELRRAWERFVTDRVSADVRTPIARSWQRSEDAGLDPSETQLAPTVADAAEASARWDAHPLARAAPLIHESLSGIARGSGHLVVVSDADGLLLWIEGDPRVRSRAADAINFAEGTLWSEAGAGTNAVGTALAADHPVQVFAGEHFNEVVHRWACSAAPIHDPDDGRLLGVIDLTGLMESAHAHSLGLAITAASAVEAQLRWVLLERDRLLRARFAERVAAGRGRRALVTPTGRVLAQDPAPWVADERLVVPPGGGELVLSSGTRAFAEPLGHEEAFALRVLEDPRGARRRARVGHVSLMTRDRAEVQIKGATVRLSRRHSEILALLMSRPAGLTSEELAADLYGDAGRPGSVRVEISRMRKLAGDWVDTEPYRLSIDIESDVGRVRGLLDRGAIREAAEGYEGPFLPRSEAPGIVREREALDAWVRQAVMTSDDTEALWAWVQSASGADDLPAWQRLLSHLEFHDTRRSLAAAQIAALRSALRT